MKNRYCPPNEYKKRYTKINRLNIVYNKYNFYIEDFYKIQNINSMYDIISQALDRMDRYRNLRTLNSYINEWIFYNKIYKLFTTLEIKKDYKYSFHYKTNIFQEILFKLASLCSLKLYKHKIKYVFYETHYHILKGDMLQWMKKKKKKKLNSVLCTI